MHRAHNPHIRIHGNTHTSIESYVNCLCAFYRAGLMQDRNHQKDDGLVAHTQLTRRLYLLAVSSTQHTTIYI